MAVLREHLDDPSGIWPVHRGLDRLAAMVREGGQTFALLCACGDGRTCHRTVVAEALNRGTSAAPWRSERWSAGLQATSGARAARIIAVPGMGIVHRVEAPEGRRAMRDRRALTVSLGAAGVAAMAVGLLYPAPRLLRQKPDDPAAKSPAEPQVPESQPVPVEAKSNPAPAPARTEPELNPLPPALPTPADGPIPGVRHDRRHDGDLDAGGYARRSQGAAKAFVELAEGGRRGDQCPGQGGRDAPARLQKVEAGLARWQAVKESLGSAATGRPGWRPRGGDGPTILEPIPPAGEPKQARPALPAGSRPAPEPVKLPESTPPVDPAAGASQPKGVVHVPPASRRGE